MEGLSCRRLIIINKLFRLFSCLYINRYHATYLQCSCQVIGLTASLGVGEKGDPVDHYIHMCANLDCSPEVMITYVRDQRHKDELSEKNPSKIESVPARHREDLFVEALMNLVRQVVMQSPGKTRHEAYKP